MTQSDYRTVFLADYRPPPFLVGGVELVFDLEAAATRVLSRLELRRNPAAADPAAPLALDGRDLELVALRLDGRELAAGEFSRTDEGLVVAEAPDAFTLEVETRIAPETNTALEGLYVSGGMLVTQCEPEGFRRITFFPDRPDVTARYQVELRADREAFPVLLCNGQPVAEGELPGGRHFVRWEDPHPKPSYLFALVAGRLTAAEESFRTRSGREVALRIFVEEHNRRRVGHALAALAKAMRWDEETFGLEYDLDLYMIVAADAFNMGAMENKGLNVFNSRYVLVSPETATDADYQAVEEVVAHEYCHNWTGNRVTCRDWFQLALKEGLTVFRDQEFSADLVAPGTKRIEDARLIRESQFAEDAGPLAHPVRPGSYVEINNFYTLTVYHKGAELVRMLQTLLGREAFRQGLRLYLERNDGRAATVEDFLAAMAEAGDRDLEPFGLWYEQAGTPVLRAETGWDAATGTWSLRLEQSCPPTPGQPVKRPLPIPVAVGLLDRQGRELPLRLEGEETPEPETTRVLELGEKSATFRFVGLEEEPVPSLLRGFSAPVRLETERSTAALAFLVAHDPDPFNRWDAAQQLALRQLLDLENGNVREGLSPDPDFLEAFRATLLDRKADPGLRAHVLTLPGEDYLGDQLPSIDPDAVHAAREGLRRELAAALREELLRVREEAAPPGPYRYHPEDAGRRRLANLCLDLLQAPDEPAAWELALRQLRGADNMTDLLAALRALAGTSSPEREAELAAFGERWRAEPLVLDKWFALQAAVPGPGTVERVRGLLDHPAYDLRNPNRVRALVGGFARGNPAAFHRRDGAGYALLAEQVLALDRLNPQVAARLATPFSRWRRYEPVRRELMRESLERLAAAGPSRDLHEVVSKSLGAGEEKDG